MAQTPNSVGCFRSFEDPSQQGATKSPEKTSKSKKKKKKKSSRQITKMCIIKWCDQCDAAVEGALHMALGS